MCYILIKDVYVHGRGVVDILLDGDKGVISSIGHNLEKVHSMSFDRPVKRFRGSSLYVSPGLIDLQMNGAFGREFVSDKTLVSEVSRFLPSCGVTSFLPTIITRESSWYERVFSKCDVLKSHEGLCKPLGWHLEGPFLNPALSGIHSKTALESEVFDEHIWRNIFLRGDVALVTLAPEIKEADMCLQLASEFHIPISIGHSAVKLSQEVSSYLKKRGVRLITHLFNAQPSFHHRDSTSIIAAVLGRHEFPFYTVISDGRHLSSEALRIARRSFPDGMIFVSDASPLLFSSSITCPFGNTIITKSSDGSMAVDEKTRSILSGSILPLHEQIHIAASILDISFIELVYETAYRASCVLGLQDKMGSLREEYVADLVAWKKVGEAYQVEASFIDGKIAYMSEGSLSRLE